MFIGARQFLTEFSCTFYFEIVWRLGENLSNIFRDTRWNTLVLYQHFFTSYASLIIFIWKVPHKHGEDKMKGSEYT